MVERAGVVLIMVLIVSVLLIQQGTAAYWRGFHSQDLGWNLNTVNREFDVSWVDTGINIRTGETVISTDTEMILKGTLAMEKGKEMMMIGFLFFGVAIGGLARGNDVYRLKHPKKKINSVARKKKGFWSKIRR